MRALFISANRERINMLTLPLGMACVAQAVRGAGHEVRVVDLLRDEQGISSLDAVLGTFDPEVIGVSVRNVDDQKMAGTRFLLEEAKAVVARCRTVSGAPVVLGGAGYSIFPDSMLAYLGADLGIQGEGEAALPALLERLGKGSEPAGVPGLFRPVQAPQRQREFERDLDRFSLPEPALWIPPGVPPSELWIPVQTRRGCPMRCSYCSTAAIEGRGIRRRSPGKVVQWIAGYARQGFRQFQFVDSTFNLPPDYPRELCGLLRREGLGISWRCILHPVKTDPDLIRGMAQAGCVEVSLGFESGSETMLRSLRKGFGKDEVREFSRALAECGIRQLGFLLLGGPGETRDSVEESLAFADALPLDALNVTVGIRIYPHTELARIAAAEGVISAADGLLFPRFYLARGLEDWLPETIRSLAGGRPDWLI
jgi:radical SAM superfamily enzyme YgiQ (UPF0313 family)